MWRNLVQDMKVAAHLLHTCKEHPMRPHYLPLLATLLLVGSPLSALAQVSPPEPAAAASALPLPAPQPSPRLMSPTELRDVGSPPGDLRPEHPVTTQINIPLGKKLPPPSKAEARAARRGYPASVGGTTNDTTARCMAIADEHARDECLAKVKPSAAKR
jgi:hypothetical protein